MRSPHHQIRNPLQVYFHFPEISPFAPPLLDIYPIPSQVKVGRYPDGGPVFYPAFPLLVPGGSLPLHLTFDLQRFRNKKNMPAQDLDALSFSMGKLVIRISLQRIMVMVTVRWWWSCMLPRQLTAAGSMARSHVRSGIRVGRRSYKGRGARDEVPRLLPAGLPDRW